MIRADSVVEPGGKRPSATRPKRRRSPATRSGRHAGRQTKLLVEQRAGQFEEDAAHVQDCELIGCTDVAHIAVMGVREWKRATHHDLKHLDGCVQSAALGPKRLPIERIEDCPTWDRSHLLEPRPLDYLGNYCCNRKCYPKNSAHARTDCVSLPVPLRERRRAEHEANLKLSKAMGLGKGFFEAAIVHASVPLPWGSTASDRRVYDPANIPLREE